MWDSYNEKFKVLAAGESGVYLVCLFNPVKSYIWRIRFILCTAASKRQQVKSGAFEIVNGNILFSGRADFRWSHQNLKNSVMVREKQDLKGREGYEKNVWSLLCVIRNKG